VSGYTRQEVAQRAGVDPDYLDRLVELGILTPDAADAFSPGDVLRARWVQNFEGAGVPLEGMAAAVRDGALSFSFMDVAAFDRFAGLTGTTFQQPGGDHSYQQSTALARGTARVVTSTALLPVTVTVAGGRGMRAAGQATGKAIRRGVSRVRPGRRRKARGGTLGLTVGGAAGYVLGAKAGRERYEQLVEAAKRWRQRPEVKRLSEQALARLDQLSDQAADKLQAARQSTGAETSSSGGQPITVAPETPTATPPAPTVVPPVDLAPMPAQPTVLPGEDASAAEERQRPAPPGPLP
jgi:hypothetical protein